MPTYQVTDPASGRTVKLTGDSPPTDQELEEIFSSLPQSSASNSEKPKEEPSLMERSLKDLKSGAIGAAETIGTIGSSIIAEPVAGLAGIASIPFKGEKSGDVVRNVRDALTYKPKAQITKNIMKDVGGAIDVAGNVIGAPVAGLKGIADAVASGSLEEGGREVRRIQERGLSRELGDDAYELGGPVAGAVVKSIPAAIVEILGFRGTRAAKNAALKAEIAENPAVLTPEVEAVLKEQGFEIDKADPKKAERLERFSQFDTKPTQGELTQDLQDLKPEQALLESAVDESGQAMRTLKREQSQAIRSSVEKTIDSLGVPSEVGNSVKEILSGRKQVLKETRRNAYEQLSQATEGQNIPVITNSLLKDMPDKGTRRTIEKTMANQSAPQALDDLLVEFGIEGDPAAVKRMEDAGIEITPLSIGNAEAFRRRLGFISKSDPSGQIEVLIGPIRENLDKEIDLMSGVLERSGNPNVAQLAKQARQANIALKTEFDPKSITEKLISKKTNSVLPNIEESKVYQTIASQSLPVEEVTRLVDAIEATGSKKAIGDLQSAMLLDLIDSAYSASSRKIDGVPTFGGPAFQKRYQQLSPKIDVIFRSNPEALQRIKALNEVAKDLTPPSGAVPKGSAGFLVDSLHRLGLATIMNRVPGGGALLEQVTGLSTKAKNRQVLERAMKADPTLKETANVIATDYPGLAAALGIGYLFSEKEEK